MLFILEKYHREDPYIISGQKLAILEKHHREDPYIIKILANLIVQKIQIGPPENFEKFSKGPPLRYFRKFGILELYFIDKFGKKFLMVPPYVIFGNSEF